VSWLVESDVLPYGLVLGGSLLAFVNAATAFRRAVNTQAFLAYAHKHAEAGDHERLRKIVAVMPRAEVMQLTARWLDLDLEPVVHAPSSGGYREAAAVVSLEERSRAALEPFVQRRRTRLRSRLPLSAVAAMAIGAGALLGHGLDWVPTLSVIGGSLAFFGGRGLWRMERDLGSALEVLVTLPRPAPVDEDDGDASGIEPPAPALGRPSRLEWQGPEGARHTLDLEPGILRVGKLPSAHIRLEGEGVSRIHAVVEVQEDGARLLDLGTEGGTRVDGEAIITHTLRAGDRITIGDHELLVR